MCSFTDSYRPHMIQFSGPGFCVIKSGPTKRKSEVFMKCWMKAKIDHSPDQRCSITGP